MTSVHRTTTLHETQIKLHQSSHNSLLYKKLVHDIKYVSLKSTTFISDIFDMVFNKVQVKIISEYAV